jgi:polyisoprenoid-binding protein YceI
MTVEHSALRRHSTIFFALKTNSNKFRVAFDVLVAGHLKLRHVVSPLRLDIPFGSRHDAPMKKGFQQLS